MFSIVLDFLTGMAVGVEWMGFDPEEDEEVAWALVFHLFILRISFVKFVDEEAPS